VALLSDLIENSRQTTTDAWARLSDSTEAIATALVHMVR